MKTRRDFLRALSASGLVCGFPTILTARGKTNDRPNIVLILADDTGYSDIGCYGGEISTPNLDALASGGVRFTQFYNTSRCCPTRASLLTGLYSHQAGIGHMAEDRGHPAYRGYLNRNCVTLGEVMRSVGYRAYIAGKWHVGSRPGELPLERGFDHFFGSDNSTGSYFGLERSGKRRLFHEDKVIPPPEGFYATTTYTDYALDYINEAYVQEKPFFLYLAYTAPHWPLHALPEDIAKYRGRYKKGWDALRDERYARMKEMGLLDDGWPLSPRGERAWDELTEEQKDEMDLRMAVYAAQIECMDRNIGRVVEHLKKTGAYENTLILFLADNGGCAEGGPLGFNRYGDGPIGTEDSFASYGECWANASNTPFRLYKHYVHEGGISTPLIAHWPGVVANAGGMTDQVGHVIDIMPTLCEVAGIDYPTEYNGQDIKPVEGKSLLPTFKGQQREGHKALFWEHEGNRAVRTGDWKLAAQHKKDWELYDMNANRSETSDLAAAQPEKVKELTQLYDAWAERCGVLPWPVEKMK